MSDDRYDDGFYDRLDAYRRDHADELRRIVEGFPPLTDEQINRLALIFRGVRPDADDGGGRDAA